jgi:hypothetical protein
VLPAKQFNQPEGSQIMNKSLAIAQNDAIQTLNGGIERLMACASSPAGEDTILAWAYGLGVKMVDGKPVAVSIDAADAFSRGPGDFAYPVVMNARRETALPVRRDQAARAHAISLQAIRADIEADMILSA